MSAPIRPRVLITKRLTEPVERALAERFEILNSPGHDPVSIGLAASGFDPHALVVRDDLPADICERAPSLLHVARHGVGLDVIPMAQCAHHQVTVSNVPGGNAVSVAEWCVAQMLALVKLEAMAGRKTSQLSGGQQQRVSIARALANKPSILLADEPTGALDSHTAEETMHLFNQLVSQGITVIVVTHDQHTADHAKRIVRMRDGEIVDDSESNRSANG